LIQINAVENWRNWSPYSLGQHHGLDALPESALGHVWTAPWQELSDVSAALVGCGHVSGLLMRRVWPLALMLCADQVPIESTYFKVRW